MRGEEELRFGEMVEHSLRCDFFQNLLLPPCPLCLCGESPSSGPNLKFPAEKATLS